MSEPKCTCPCIDCIEGNHCGGEYWWPPEPVENEDGTIIEPQLIGICEHIVLDDLVDPYTEFCDDMANNPYDDLNIANND